MNKKEIHLFNNYLKKYENAVAKNDLSKSEIFIRKLIHLEPKNHAALNELGTILSKSKKHKEALKIHLEAADIDPTNKIILANIGLDYLNLEDFSNAEKFLKFSLSQDENFFDAYIFLGVLYHSFGKFNELIKIATDALTRWPKKFEFHNMLSSGLIGYDLIDDASFSAETALLLNPQSIEAKINLALTYDLKGLYEDAIKIYNSIIDSEIENKDRFISQIKYNLSYSNLSIGNIDTGWDLYDFGFDINISRHMRRRPTRNFDQQMWRGEAIDDKTLLVWCEQGLGDEILFMSLIADLLNMVKNVILECDSRLIPIATRSFPTLRVRNSTFDLNGNQLENDFDLHIPIGSLNRIFRKNLSSYKNNNAYLIPPPISNPEIYNFINKNKKLNKIIIGLCWRSGLIDIERSKNYIPLSEWKSIFEIPNAIFINLQYGECRNEIENAQKIYNVEIKSWTNIDLKNDLETVFEIIRQLDYVITAATAVSPISFSIGVQTLTFQKSYGWTNLGSNKFPWSNSMIQFVPKSNMKLNSVLNDIKEYILNSTDNH
jgi:tetratricopeptide (TPR) repeat protein